VCFCQKCPETHVLLMVGESACLVGTRYKRDCPVRRGLLWRFPEKHLLHYILDILVARICSLWITFVYIVSDIWQWRCFHPRINICQFSDWAAWFCCRWLFCLTFSTKLSFSPLNFLRQFATERHYASTSRQRKWEASLMFSLWGL